MGPRAISEPAREAPVYEGYFLWPSDQLIVQQGGFRPVQWRARIVRSLLELVSHPSHRLGFRSLRLVLSLSILGASGVSNQDSVAVHAVRPPSLLVRSAMQSARKSNRRQDLAPT